MVWKREDIAAHCRFSLLPALALCQAIQPITVLRRSVVKRELEHLLDLLEWGGTPLIYADHSRTVFLNPENHREEAHASTEPRLFPVQPTPFLREKPEPSDPSSSHSSPPRFR
ncbi:hypothetical protein SKAU_G00024970 [Synaphobranchus kaupii]|uniref:Uncharacterized protein n=1 Tax=Synaphobranchus kaupii TaxID=118154 RepID=A0A9Q1JF25_SYNKA|nr:hypothetical protein SKAU_G00024970 [Synaphobranchus kaupii]